MRPSSLAVSALSLATGAYYCFDATGDAPPTASETPSQFPQDHFTENHFPESEASMPRPEPSTGSKAFDNTHLSKPSTFARRNSLPSPPLCRILSPRHPSFTRNPSHPDTFFNPQETRQEGLDRQRRGSGIWHDILSYYGERPSSPPPPSVCGLSGPEPPSLCPDPPHPGSLFSKKSKCRRSSSRHSIPHFASEYPRNTWDRAESYWDTPPESASSRVWGDLYFGSPSTNYIPL